MAPSNRQFLNGLPDPENAHCAGDSDLAAGSFLGELQQSPDILPTPADIESLYELLAVPPGDDEHHLTETGLDLQDLDFEQYLMLQGTRKLDENPCFPPYGDIRGSCSGLKCCSSIPNTASSRAKARDLSIGNTASFRMQAELTARSYQQTRNCSNVAEPPPAASVEWISPSDIYQSCPDPLDICSGPSWLLEPSLEEFHLKPLAERPGLQNAQRGNSRTLNFPGVVGESFEPPWKVQPSCVLAPSFDTRIERQGLVHECLDSNNLTRKYGNSHTKKVKRNRCLEDELELGYNQAKRQCQRFPWTMLLHS
ncbi:hypothetical protein TWF192_011264 [Orbilia oligospora]|uniref:Uncharacterized protein n=1 Tax=Orbilia oligospora TaxID=2813651 RepID=A0A6G1LWK0_ORBOL|nr:hypothetical protein TWF191_008714 [Orbilia oligospora]KAF3236942.1 hypothetical protein TWF192_011264 [Orbilia oligospora]